MEREKRGRDDDGEAGGELHEFYKKGEQTALTGARIPPPVGRRVIF